MAFELSQVQDGAVSGKPAHPEVSAHHGSFRSRDHDAAANPCRVHVQDLEDCQQTALLLLPPQLMQLEVFFFPPVFLSPALFLSIALVLACPRALAFANYAHVHISC